MIVINGKTYRNLEEQVQKNKEDIEALGGGGTAEITGTTIAAHTNSTTTIVKNIGDNGNVEYNLATPVVTKIDNSLQLPGTGLGKTELVGIGVNNKQVNIEIDTNTLNITNNKLSVIAGSTGGVTKEYVDAQDEKLHQSITTTDSQVQTLNEEITTIKTDTIPAINNTLNNKLDKATSTTGAYAYVRTGTRDTVMGINALVGSDEIARRTSAGTLKVNAAVEDNDCVNKKQLDDAIAGVSGSEVTKAYVDNGLAGKLDKLENTSDRTECYVNQAGTNRLLNTSTNATRNLIVRWDNGGKLHSNTATTGDEVVNYNQWTTQNNDLKANIDLKANLTANTCTGVQTISNEMEGALVFNKTSVTPFTELFKLTYTANETPITETFRIPMTTENAAHYLITSKTVNNGAGLNYDRNANSLTVGHKITFASGMTIIYVTAKGVADTLTTTESTSIKDIVAMKVTATAGLNMTGCALDVANTKLLINESTLEQMTNKELIPLTDIIYQ